MVALRQSYPRVGKFALIKHQRYARAKQFKRANRSLESSRPISAASSATFGAKRLATRA
jgi:IS5 family transposase